MNIVSLNIGMSQNVARLSALLVSYNVDLALLQEVNSSQEQLNAGLESIGFQAEVNVRNIADIVLT